MSKVLKYFFSFVCLFIISLLCGCATVDGTAGSIYQACTGWGSVGEAMTLYCESYFNSVLQNVKNYNYMHNNQFFNPIGYQIDSDFGRALFYNYLKKHPEQRKLPANQVYLNAMSDYFKNN